MTEKQVLEQFRQRELKSLLARAEKIAKEKTYRHLKGMIFGSNILAINIDSDHTIYIDLEARDVSLITIYNLDHVSHESLDQLKILHRFLSEFDDEVKKINHRSFWKKLFSFGKKNNFNSIDLFRKAETWWYKSILSGRILSYCYRENHSYTFELPGDRQLHITLPARYLTDEGVYRLERQSEGNSAFFNERDCQEEILEACKYLVEHEEVLRAVK